GRRSWQALMHATDTGPGILAQPLQAPGYRLDGKSGRIEPGCQLLPIEWHRDRRALLGACGVRRDGRRGGVVAKVVDEDPSLSLGLRYSNEVSAGFLHGHCLRRVPRELFDSRPVVAANDRNDDMQPLAAGELGEGGEVGFRKYAAQLVSCLHDVGEPQALAGIEVEDHSVRPVRAVNTYPPGVDLENAHLDERNQPLHVPNEEVGARVLEALDHYLIDLR